jgi:hypothetical protein
LPKVWKTFSGSSGHDVAVVVDDPPGLPSDALDAWHALAAVVKAPWWVRPLAVVGAAAAVAAAIGSGVTAAGIATAVVIMLATIYVPAFVLVRQRRTLGVRLRRRRRTRRQWLFTWLMFVVFVATANGLLFVLPLRTPLAYVVEFVAAALIFGTYIAINTRDPVKNNAARLILPEDRPGEFDYVFGSRSRLKLGTCLGAIAEIELGLLGHCLQQHPYALTPHLTELTTAQYVCFRDDDGRRWLAMTPDGRVRFRRHLAALLTVPA